jgi:transcriptional regulator with XRE-family HTH domain
VLICSYSNSNLLLDKDVGNNMKNKADFLMRMANNIRRYRKEKCFSQESFARHIKIARRNYSDIEMGRVSPSIVLLMKIALGLEVPLAALIPDGFVLEENSEELA